MADPRDTAQGIYGFYQTWEGRDFLREIYRRYVDRVEFGERKIAAMIADEQSFDQKMEDDATRSALKRWRTGKSELWDRDSAKTIRLLMRLEGHMMAVPEIAELCEDRAASLRKTDLGNALSVFFYGAEKSATSAALLSARLQKFAGLYRLMYAEIDARWKVNLAERFEDRNVFRLYRKHETFNFLVFQTFRLVRRLHDQPGTVQQRLSAGFCYLGPDGGLAHFAVDLSDPTERGVEICTMPTWEAFKGIEGVERGQRYKLATSSYSTAIHRTHAHDKHMVNGNMVAIIPVEMSYGAKFERHYSSIIWDIPL